MDEELQASGSRIIFHNEEIKHNIKLHKPHPGNVEGVKDLISFEGSNVDDLEEGFRYMVDEHISDCTKKNIPLEKSYKGNLNIRLSPELHKKAAYNAALRGVSLNQYINDAIKKDLSSSDPDF